MTKGKKTIKKHKKHKKPKKQNKTKKRQNRTKKIQNKTNINIHRLPYYHHPTIGILSIPMTASYQKNTHSYIPASYVKWIQMNNARVVPIPYDTPIGSIKMILNQINGMLFIGGQVDHGMISQEYVRFMQTFKEIVNFAKKENNNGRHFPIFSICLGMEILAMMSLDHSKIIKGFLTRKIISNVDAHKMNAKLNFEHSSSNMIFNADEIDEFRKNDCVFMNHGQGYLTNNPYMKKIYNKYWSTIATSKDKKGNEYVSFFKFNKYPFYGCQFHPEKVLFEWILPEIGRTPLYRKISHKLSYFFVNEARKNKRQFKMPDLDIKNYNLWSRSETMSKIKPNKKLFKKNNSSFENSYYFDIISNS